MYSSWVAAVRCAISHITSQEKSFEQLSHAGTIKFSRHLVVHLPNDAMFRNTSHAGSFVSDFLACHETMFWVRSSRDDHTVRFVDESVYSRNRAFRMFLCSKRTLLFLFKFVCVSFYLNHSENYNQTHDRWKRCTSAHHWDESFRTSFCA